MSDKFRSYLMIHAAVLLFGLTGILGDLISLGELTLVWWRMGLTALSLMLIPGVIKKALAIPVKDRWRMFGIGGLVAIHWVTFFGAIQLTNPSVTLACLASASLFTAILEPILTKRRFKLYEILLGIVVIPGVAVVYQSSNFQFWGILVALISAALAATFAILNKKLIERNNAVSMTMIEIGSGWLILSLGMPFYHYFQPDLPFLPHTDDLLWLGILAFGCTSLAYVISLEALRHLPTFTVNLTINLEPVYTIVIAFLLLEDGNELDSSFFIGAATIILSIFAHPFLSRYFDKDNKLKET